MPRLSNGNEIGGFMNRLYVLYDANCGLCSSVREWVQEQPHLVAMEFVAANSPQASVLFPSLSRPAQRPEELIVVDDSGGVYREGHAWIMCLYALADYRALSLRLASPTLLPLARKAFGFLSKRRSALSELLGMGSDRQMAARLEQENWIGCAPASNPAGYDVAPPRISGGAELRDGWSN
jgi:predicted DCC family thiol-disulfide oxidoreductase YuxK